MTVWLVADGARWTLTAGTSDAGPVVSSGGSPKLSVPADPPTAAGMRAMAFDSSFDSPASLAGHGQCSWRGRTCRQEPVISFEDPQGRRQSGCQRAVEELTSRGELA